MANPDTIQKMKDRIWQSSPEHVRKTYGEEYYQITSTSLGNGRDNPEEVADAMLDAVIAVEPETRYKCCGFATALQWKALELLPFDISEYLKKKSLRKPGKVLKPAEGIYAY